MERNKLEKVARNILKFTSPEAWFTLLCLVIYLYVSITFLLCCFKLSFYPLKPKESSLIELCTRSKPGNTRRVSGHSVWIQIEWCDELSYTVIIKKFSEIYTSSKLKWFNLFSEYIFKIYSLLKHSSCTENCTYHIQIDVLYPTGHMKKPSPRSRMRMLLSSQKHLLLVVRDQRKWSCFIWSGKRGLKSSHHSETGP